MLEELHADDNVTCLDSNKPTCMCVYYYYNTLSRILISLCHPLDYVHNFMHVA